MDPHLPNQFGEGNPAYNPAPGPADGAAGAQRALGGESGLDSEYKDSYNEQSERPGEEEYDEEEDEDEDEEDEDDEEEEIDYADEDEDEEEYAGRNAKRKRGSSSALDSDLRLAQQMQQDWGGATGRRSSRGGSRGAYAESSDLDYADEEEGSAAVGGGGGRRSASAAPGAGGAGGGLKLKIKLPNPVAAFARGTSPPAQQTTAGGTVSNAMAPSGTVMTEEEEVQWIEWDDDEAEAREEAAKKRRRMPHCLLSFDELAGLDDEVERVLGHRDIEGVEPNPKDPWSTREFYVKWARYSYIHCSWDSYTTLSQLGGFKRVLNYCRKMDALAANRANLTVEEREDLDLRLELEAELEREHSQVERIVGERLIEEIPVPQEGDENGASGAPTAIVQYLIKWQGLPYSEATWESAADVEKCGATELVNAFHQREETSLEPRRTVDAARRAFNASGHRAFEQQPDYLQGDGKLRDYQLEGLNWMAYSWARGVNGILADEMGLGKTVQCASMIGYLSQFQNIGGPFLIVVPLSTVPNWAREFKKWIPQVNTVVYVGDAPSREVIRTFEFPLQANTTGRAFKFDAIITTYELALKDAAILRNVKWSYMMVDEAHRLKNNESALYRELSQWNFKSKLLITGTPLQNNMRELWCLLHFLHPEKFPSAEDFEEDHDPQDPAGVQRLHAVLRPHLLRRVIKDVEKSLPPKNERILRVPMTPLQKQYYKWILTRNFKELNKSSKGSQVTLLNIIMDLKKCCNHPFLFESARENYNGPGGADVDRLVVTSGKMVLLDKLLRRLKETGHRVLIFSQMVRVLDILSEYMTLRGYRHQRLDGSTPAHQRHQAMERFNAPDSQDFAFLLSTRAGGLGINLATADTVLLFDSDWNPQNDLQAMARAHRIGQKDIVNIYRLVTSGSVEEDILERAKSKMVLDHVVIQRMDTSGRTVLDPGAAGGTAGARMFGKDELAAILKFGAGELFKEEDGAAAGGAAGGEGSADAAAAAAAAAGAMMSDEDLDAILARAEVVEQREEDAPGGAGDLLASFNVATFKAGDEDDAAFWSKLIPDHMRPKDQPEVTEEPGIRQARLKAMEGPAQPNPLLSFKPKQKKPKAEPGPPVEGAMLRIERWPQGVDEEGRLIAGEDDPRPHGFPRALSKRDAFSFVRGVKRRGLFSKIDLIAGEVGDTAAGMSNSKTLAALWHGLLRGCEKAVDLHAKRARALQPPGAGNGGIGAAGSASGVAGGSAAVPMSTNATPTASTDTGMQCAQTAGAASAAAPAASAPATGGSKLPADARLDFFGVDVRAADLLAFVRQMALLEGKVGSFATQPDAARRLRLTMAERPAPTAWMRACGWTPEDDSALLVGVYRHGLGAWDKICDDQDLRLGGKLAGAAGKEGATRELPKSSHLDTRTNGLLRQIEKVATRPPKPPKAPVAGRGRGPGGAPTPSAAPSRLEPSSAAIAAFKEVAARCEANLGEPTNTLVRKLRTLQRKGNEMDSTLVINKTRKYMGSIGKRILEVAENDNARAELWAYLSEYTENPLSGERLEHFYNTLKHGHRHHHHHKHHGHGGDTQQAAGEGVKAEEAVKEEQYGTFGAPAVHAGVPIGAVKKEEQAPHAGNAAFAPQHQQYSFPLQHGFHGRVPLDDAEMLPSSPPQPHLHGQGHPPQPLQYPPQG